MTSCDALVILDDHAVVRRAFDRVARDIAAREERELTVFEAESVATARRYLVLRRAAWIIDIKLTDS